MPWSGAAQLGRCSRRQPRRRCSGCGTLSGAVAAAERQNVGPLRMTRWSEDDRLWGAMAPALSALARHAIADAEVAAIIKGTELPTGAQVLDLGCGAGLHAVAFASRGFVVTGVDTSRTLLHSAQTRASAAGLVVEFIDDDIRTFIRPACYDLICRWTVETNNVAERYLTEQRIYSAAELISMAQNAGLAAVRVSSSLDATAPYVASSLRLVVFARQ